MKVKSVVLCAARYQNELAGVEAEQLAERFYHQALSVSPTIGEKHPTHSLFHTADCVRRRLITFFYFSAASLVL